jgi:hypothetical protein
MSTVVLPPGAPAAAVAGEPGTGGVAGYGSAATAAAQLCGATYPAGMAIVLDPAGPLFAAIGSSNLRAFTDGTDTVPHQAISN